jgi:hypothetical protein
LGGGGTLLLLLLWLLLALEFIPGSTQLVELLDSESDVFARVADSKDSPAGQRMSRECVVKPTAHNRKQ